MWNETSIEQIPQGEVVGFHPTWVDEDFNPEGTRMGFMHDEGYFISSKWCDNQDTYVNHEDTIPTHWCFKPQKPIGFIKPDEVNIDPRWESIVKDVKHDFNGSMSIDLSPKGTIMFLYAGNGTGINQATADMLRGCIGFLRKHYPETLRIMNVQHTISDALLQKVLTDVKALPELSGTEAWVEKMVNLLPGCTFSSAEIIGPGKALVHIISACELSLDELHQLYYGIAYHTIPARMNIIPVFSYTKKPVV